MIWSAVASALHLMSLAGGVACILLRADALARPLDQAGLRRLFAVDNAYGLLALTWIGSGLWRALGGLEKGTAYYLHNHLFWGKLLIIVVLMGVEMVPMITFIRWRIQLGRGETPDTSRAPRLRRLHWIELAAVIVLIPIASGIARGVGVVDKRPSPSAAGERIFTTVCATCHGLDGQGRNGLAADFARDQTRLAKSDEALLRAIEKGVPGTAMAGFGATLSPNEMRAVLAYVRARFQGP